MDTKIVRIYIDGIQNYADKVFKVDFFNQQRAYDKFYELDNLISSLNVHTTMAFVGANASGKTMSLKLIKWCLDFLVNGNESISTLNKIAFFDDKINISVMLYRKDRKHVMIEHTIVIDNSNQDYPIISDEFVKYKNVSDRDSKENMLDFSNPIIVSRTQFEKVLFDEKRLSEKGLNIEDAKDNLKLNNQLSLVKYINIYKKTDAFFVSCNLSENSLQFKNAPRSLIQYLDNSILKLEEINQGSDSKSYKLEFDYGFQVVGSLPTISSYLSSGTLRGLHLFSKAIEVLKHGGYLFIDEIEVSLHKSLVIDVLKLFNSKNTNPHQGILIFSTHYSEILDSIRRSDSIYLCSKTISNKIEINNLSDLTNRNDLLKSEIYASGLTKKPSSPSYQLYQKFLKDLDDILHTTSVIKR